MKNYVLFFILVGFLKSGIGYSQDVNVKIGIKDSLQSKILNENRPLIVSLPKDYETSNLTYPVLFLLDGSVNNLIDARLIIHNLRLEIIIVAITNTDRDRDMMPISRPSYEVENPKAENFISFLETELVPYIDKKYRTNGQKTIRGRSLSGLFVMYAFLSKPELFDNYIGNCAGWFADMNTYFNKLADKSFQNKDNLKGKKIFVANSLADPLDPNKEIHQSMVDLFKRMKYELDNRIKFEYKTYENAGHVPYSSFYDGMKFIFKKE
ncbi:alpha/beta hydrolase [Psychroserpens algicola]|uniref:Alpha/beta hydrolase-fold protein n=1 Tax=Psychroserpens algicola TaxID=1719034 RepID=A0ABT0HCC7_9FLAO|nr:alpha/beta hydrolase-fold protein [Psychroserpens algicola]MCK8481704.1 alpha/beta hydrolase-fold protein [Psychroserpens algicola]